VIIPTFEEMDDAVEGLLELFEEQDSQSLVDLIKASFAGDRSAAGRYAAQQRWKGNAKDDISNQVTVGFESEGKNRGTVWATDKATGKVVGALKFDANFIGKIYVAKDYRRKGIGSFLYNEAKKHNGGVEMKADDYTVSGAGFMSAVTGKEVFQTGDNSWAGIEWKSWLERLDRDALKKQSLVDLIKASFAGDRSAAGRYAAEQRWKGHAKVDEPRDYQNISLAEYEKLSSVTSQKEKAVDSPVARKAYGVWGTSSFVQINETLRGHEIDEDSWIPESFSAEEAAQSLKDNFDAFAVELPKDATVFRGVAYESEVGFIEEGTIFTDKGLISTSTTFKFARSFGDGSELDLVFDIQIPKGTKVWAPKTAFVKQETEITLRPGTRFKVKQVYDESDDYGDVRRVVMEVIND